MYGDFGTNIVTLFNQINLKVVSCRNKQVFKVIIKYGEGICQVLQMDNK